MEGPTEVNGSITLTITNLAATPAEVNILDAYTGQGITRALGSRESFEQTWSLAQFHAWYDLIITVAADPTFRYEYAGHIELGQDSISDPAMGGLVTLKSWWRSYDPAMGVTCWRYCSVVDERRISDSEV